MGDCLARRKSRWDGDAGVRRKGEEAETAIYIGKPVGRVQSATGSRHFSSRGAKDAFMCLISFA